MTLPLPGAPMEPVPHDNRSDFLRALLNAIPSPILVVDQDVRILDYNQAAAELVGEEPTVVLSKRGGDALHCINALEAPGGCGTGPACGGCTIRNSVRQAYEGKRVCRVAKRMQRSVNGQTTEVNLAVTTAPIDYGGESLVLLVLEDVTELMSLRRIVPVCAGCRKIRDDQQYWQHVDLYFKRHLDIDVTHGICPECEARFYPEFAKKP